jgi:hypothetical protein
LQRLKDIGADVVDDRDSFLILQVALPNASASPRILSEVADIVELREELDLVEFGSMPIDAREPVPSYPSPWERLVSLRPPARDAFVIQFATAPLTGWLESLRAAGVTILKYIPQNAYVVLGDSDTLAQFVTSRPVQLFRLHQPFHKVSTRVRESTAQIEDFTVSIATVPEAMEALALLESATIARLAPADPTGDRTSYRVTLPAAVVPQLAALPAVLSIDLYSQATPSGQREANLTLGDTLVTNSSGVLKPLLGDSRAWIASKGVGNYKTAVKMAILDSGFDLGDPVNVHPDFKDSAGNSFISIQNYTAHNQGGSNADCFGHGTFVAGVLAGNAGAAHSTQNRDSGSDGSFLMGLGILPEMPLIVGRVFNYLPGVTPFGYDPQPFTLTYADLASRGVAIVSNSFNEDGSTNYTVDDAVYDQLVRSSSGQNGGPPMTIYFAGGNYEYPTFQTRVSAWATAKNVIGVGGSENYNPNTYTDPPLIPPANSGEYSNNGNQTWSNESVGPTTSDGRIKPDLVAPASAIESAQSRQSNSGCQAGAVGITIDGGTHYWSRGTSFSTPLAAGEGALLYTWFKNTTGAAPTPALLKAMQINFAYDLTGANRPPDPAQGWGKADLTRAFATDGRYSWADEGMSTLLTTAGQTIFLPNGPTSGYQIRDTSKPVRVTLVWTDAPSDNVYGGNALVNDLDLTVRMLGAGNGKYALGNDFNSSTGRSNVRNPGGGGTSNNRDNVEQVVFTYADAGADHFSVEVFAKTLGKDGINVWPPPAVNQQNFALFIENAVAYQNNASFAGQSVQTTVAAGANYSPSFTFQNTGTPATNTAWSEGPTELYRLGYLPSGGPFPWGSRLSLDPGQTITNPQSKQFQLNATAPYAAGLYPLQWQMVEEPGHVFGSTSTFVNVTVTASPTSFYTLTPCRVVDTRWPAGTYGAPSLAPGVPRTFPIRGQCGVPNTARAVSVNMTAVSAAGQGVLKAYPANISSPLVSTLNYGTGQTRANNAIVTLDTQGNLVVGAGVAGADLLLDVNGYFQ